jgi:hypothetical protein
VVPGMFAHRLEPQPLAVRGADRIIPSAHGS